MVTQLVGGLRSGMGYTGCHTIREFQEKTRFWAHHVCRLEGVARSRRDHHQRGAKLPVGVIVGPLFCENLCCNTDFKSEDRSLCIASTSTHSGNCFPLEVTRPRRRVETHDTSS